MATVHSRCATTFTFTNRRILTTSTPTGAEPGAEVFPSSDKSEHPNSTGLAVVGLQHLLYLLIPLVVFVVRLGHHLVILKLLLQLLLPVRSLRLWNKSDRFSSPCWFYHKNNDIQIQKGGKNWCTGSGQLINDGERERRWCLPSGDERLFFLSSTSCSISFFRSSWSMAVESKASLTNSDTPGLVDISSSSSRCGWGSQRRTVSGSKPGLNVRTPSGSHLLDVTDGNRRSFGPNCVCENNPGELSQCLTQRHQMSQIRLRKVSKYRSICTKPRRDLITQW